MAARRINLLPRELAARRRGRQLGAAIVAASLVLVGVLALIFLIGEVRLRGEEGRLDRQEEKNDDLRAQVATLDRFARQESELRQKMQLLADLTKEEVRWSIVLADVGLVIPSDVWLTQFTGNVRGTEEAEQDEASLGGIDFSGVTFSHVDVAKWLTRLGGVDGFTFPYLSLSSKASIGEVSVVDFSSTVNLSDGALRHNQKGAERRV